MWYVFIFLMVDYLLTYVGIQFGIIEEANPLMVWLFKLPLYQGLPVRLLMSLAITAPIIYLERHCTYYKKFFSVICAIYAVVFVLHVMWIKEI